MMNTRPASHHNMDLTWQHNMERLPSLEKPKRPLSAYNLYFRFKRLAMLEAINNFGDNFSAKETVHQLINIMPGLEGCSSSDIVHLDTLSDTQVNEIRRTKIRSALQHNIYAKKTSKRSHRKSHGAMSFTEMNKIMGDGWKRTDEFAKEVFDELASEGRTIYQARLAEYKKKCTQPSKAVAKIKSANVTSKTSLFSAENFYAHTSPTSKPSPSKSPNIVRTFSRESGAALSIANSMEMESLSARHGSFNTEESSYGNDVGSKIVSKTSGPEKVDSKATISSTNSPVDGFMGLIHELGDRSATKMAGVPIVSPDPGARLSYGQHMRENGNSIATQPTIEFPPPPLFVRTTGHEKVEDKAQIPWACASSFARKSAPENDFSGEIASLEKSKNITQFKLAAKSSLHTSTTESKAAKSLQPLPFMEMKGSTCLDDELSPSTSDYMELLSNICE